MLQRFAHSGSYCGRPTEARGQFAAHQPISSGALVAPAVNFSRRHVVWLPKVNSSSSVDSSARLLIPQSASPTAIQSCGEVWQPLTQRPRFAGGIKEFRLEESIHWTEKAGIWAAQPVSPCFMASRVTAGLQMSPSTRASHPLRLRLAVLLSKSRFHRNRFS